MTRGEAGNRQSDVGVITLTELWDDHPLHEALLLLLSAPMRGWCVPNVRPRCCCAAATTPNRAHAQLTTCSFMERSMMKHWGLGLPS